MRLPSLALITVLFVACQGGTDGPDDPGGGGAADAGASMHPPDAAMTCMPKTCAQRGAECGTTDDGCGHTLDCGYCLFQSDACESNQCVCQPSCYMRQCGDDGCGGSCGSCGANESCNQYGKCVYDGSGTSPPPTWHCPAAYWDAGDGCDCNCGALDPDCGQAGQTLHGCTGLNGPTCNAQGLCTGGGACHSVPGSAYMTDYMVIQSA